MATTLTLYNCKITRDRNAKVDNIQDYLSSVTIRYPLSGTLDVQYQQIELHKSFKLAISQNIVGQQVYNYLDFYQDSKHFYYFVDKAIWKSTMTVEFELTLDTVNTFAGNYSFNKKTHILRQHKDRLIVKDYLDRTVNADDEDGYMKLHVPFAIGYEWENEEYDNGSITVDSPSDGECVYRVYQNQHIIEEHNVYRVRYGNYAEGGGYVYQVYDEVQLVLNKSKAEMKQDYENGIYHVIEYMAYNEDGVYNNGWTAIFMGEYHLNFIRKIDMKEEGLQPPQFKYREGDVVHSVDDIAWNLAYIAKNAYDSSHPEDFTVNNPLECFLYPERAIQIPATRSQDTTYTASDLEEGTYYFFLPKFVVPDGISSSGIYNYYTGQWAYDFTAKVYKDGQEEDYQEVTAISSQWHYEASSGHSTNTYSRLDVIPTWFVITKGESKVTVTQYTYQKYSGYYNKIKKVSETLYNNSEFRLKLVTTGNNLWIWEGNSNPSISNYIIYWRTVKGFEPNTWSFGGLSYFNLKPMSNTLKTDSRVMKVIQLPYCPLRKYYYSDEWVYDTNGWIFDVGEYALKKIDIEADTESSITLVTNPLDLLVLNYANPYLSDLRNDDHESKVYNSEFYTPKFVYDSFVYTYNLENIDIEKVENFNDSKEIKYKTSNTFTGNFLFDMNTPLQRSISNYDNIVIVNRNNELPIYTSAYMNYVRSGYNWDVKNKNLQLTKGLVTTSISTAGGALSGLLMGALGGSSAGPVGAIIGAGIGLAGSLVNLALNQVQADNQIKQKLDETSRQGVSVNSCDDINLLSYYTEGNKAKQVEYQASTKFIDIIRDLFYYCGYADDVQAVPNLNSRIWFNYIQCEPVFNEQLNLVYQEYLEDIKQRYKEGVTVYHMNKISNVKTWDWDQTHENWETNIINAE